MSTPLALAVLLLAASARAADPKSVPGVTGTAVAEAPRYYSWSGRTAWWGDLIARKDISLVADLPNLDELCMIPPAADWVTSGASPETEEKYLHLLWRVSYSIADRQGKSNIAGRTIGACGVNADAQIVGLGDFSNFFVGAFDDSIKKRTGFSGCLRSQTPVPGSPQYAGFARSPSNAGLAVKDTLKLLLKSRNPMSVVGALTQIKETIPAEVFRKDIEALVRDKSQTATVTLKPDGVSQTLPVRVWAMRALATIDRTQRTAELLALIWHDEKESPAVREGAMRAFSFIVEWAGPAIDAEKNRPSMHKALFPFIVPLLMIYDQENDAKQAGGAGAKLSSLGQAASCALDRYPRPLVLKAKRGEKP